MYEKNREANSLAAISRALAAQSQAQKHDDAIAKAAETTKVSGDGCKPVYRQ